MSTITTTTIKPLGSDAVNHQEMTFRRPEALHTRVRAMGGWLRGLELGTSGKKLNVLKHDGVESCSILHTGTSSEWPVAKLELESEGDRRRKAEC